MKPKLSLHISRGFTVIELSLFAAIFATISIVFITLLVVVTRIQVRESSMAEVNGQSQFLLQTIQRQVEQASAIELAADLATTTLKLRTPGADPTYIYLDSGTVYMKQTDTGTPQPLTSNRVSISSLAFTKRANTRARDSVSVAFTMTYNSLNVQQQFSQILDMSVARVTAATFDSNLNNSAPGSWSVGSAPGEWQSINSTIYFSGSNVGIGSTAPTAKLQVNGDVYIDTPTRGLILKEGSSCYRVSISGGTLTTASISCP